MTIKSKFVISYLILLLPAMAYSQGNTTIYIGLGSGTNIGGVVGVGIEHYVSEYLSFSGAIGTFNIRSKPKDITFSDRLSYDLGAKVYPLRWFFIGANYGFLDFEYEKYTVYDGDEVTYSYRNFEKYFGFSFTFGFKVEFLDRISLSAYYGTTPYEERNCLGPKFSDFKQCFPKVGVLLAYKL